MDTITYHDLSDHSLISLIREDDKLAYTEIFKRYNSLIYIHAFRKLQNREEARDVVQDAFATLWVQRQHFKLQSNLAGFLYTCVHHKILDFVAHQKIENKYVGFLQHFLNNNKNTTDYLIREKQLAAIIEKEIAMLPNKMREVFELSRKKQLSHKEIAQQLNISEETVKSQVKNALKILRIRLGLLTYLIFLIRF